MGGIFLSCTIVVPTVLCFVFRVGINDDKYLNPKELNPRGFCMKIWTLGLSFKIGLSGCSGLLFP